MEKRIQRLFICRVTAGIALALLSTLNGQLSTAFAQGTAFTYQGRLNDGGAPANGLYDLIFTLFDTRSGDGELAGPVTNSATAVTNGLFTTVIDFGSGAFKGSNCWLDISVRTNGGGSFSSLSPRQPITPTPYAITAAGLAGVAQNDVVSGTNATVSGGYGNVSAGQGSFVGGGFYNSALGNNAAVAGGQMNAVGPYGFVGGGYSNSAVGNGATIPGGGGNHAGGKNSFAAGSSAYADYDYSFVWSDGSSPPAFSATTTNQFSVLASGGVRFVTGGAGMTLDGQAVTTANALAAAAAAEVSTNFGVAGNLTLGGNNTNSGTLWNKGSVTGGTYSNVTFGSQVSGLSTNLGIGEFWACDFGYSPTNTAAGNAVVMDRIINVVSNAGGGIIRLGSRFATGQQVIQDSGEHMFPPLGGLVEQHARFKLKGDNSIVVRSTLTSTGHGVFWGQFDAEDFSVLGSGTNAAWAYPYTNYVGIYEIGFNNPQVKNVTVSGFGQGFAMEELGSINGSLWEQDDASQCMIGYAVGEACDAMHMIGSSARKCLIGMDQACLVPIPTNVPVYSGLSYTGSNVGGSRAVLISGGLWAYNNIMFVLGKAQDWKIQNMHTEFVTGALLHIGHTNNIYPLANEIGATHLTLDSDEWVGGGPMIGTNIVPNASAGTLTIRNCSFNNAAVGIYGNLIYLDTDGSIIGTTNWLAVGGSVYNMRYKPLFYTSPGYAPTWFNDEEYGFYSPGATIYRFDSQMISSDTNVTVWTAGVVDGSFNVLGDRHRLSYINEGTFGLLSLAHASEQITGGNLYNAQTNATSFEVVTNTIQINSNSVAPTPVALSGKLWVSNQDLYWVTTLKTNLVVLGH